MMSKDLVLVRHGESEGNAATRRAKAGDTAVYDADFLRRHSSEFRLTDKGRKQAAQTGAWLKENGFSHFDRYYVSEYIRAMETAVGLDLTDAKWRTSFQLRERDFGRMDINTPEDRAQRFKEYLEMRERQPFYSPLPDGESMADVCNRLQTNIIPSLHRVDPDSRVLIVSHGALMHAMRIILEHCTAEQYNQSERENSPAFRIGNGQVVHYTRTNPENPNEVKPYYNWVRSVNPHDPTYSGHSWWKIEHKKYSNGELKALVEAAPRQIAE